MGINPTPTNHRSFTFDGKSTREFGVYITGEGVFNAPERAVEMISIPGRDGEYALDQGHFNNIEVTYRAGIVADSTTDFAEAISNFRNWLASREGYCRLTDEYNTEEYRMAVFKNAIALEHEGLLTGEFDVTFDCKPQRYLAIGEELVEIGAWGNTETAEGEIVTIDASSDTAVKALTVDIDPIQDLHGYDAPWVGGAGKNKFDGSQVTQSSSYNWDVSWSSEKLTIEHKTTYSTGVPTSATMSLTSGTYVLSYTATTNINFDLYINGAFNKTIRSGDAFTISNGDTCYFTFPNSSATTITYSNIQVELGSSPTSYAPYENICPISGWDEVGVSVYGKNLLNSNSMTDGYVSANGAINSSSGAPRYEKVSDYIPIESGRPYVFSCTINNSEEKWVGIGIYNASKQFIGRIGSTLGTGINVVQALTSAQTSGAYFARVSLRTYNNMTDAQFEEGTEPTEYEEYKYYTTTLPATTYGGTLDVVSGVLTVTYGVGDLGTLGWERQQYSANQYRFKVTIPDLQGVSSSTAGDGICSVYPIISNHTQGANWVNHSISFGSGTSVYLIENDYTTVEAFKTAMSGQKLVYKLATPTTVQLTGQQIALLLGENHIFADSGNVTVEYGHNPTLLTNPTWFPSKPNLQIWGVGDINLGEKKITVTSDPIGEAVISNHLEVYSTTTTVPINVLANVGDVITLNGGLVNGRVRWKIDSGTITDVSITAVGGGGNESHPNTATYVYLWAYSEFSSQSQWWTFEYGVASSRTVTCSVTLTTSDFGELTGTLELEMAYDGDKTITITISETLPQHIKSDSSMVGYKIMCDEIIIDSTYPALNAPLYLDLDIGEAYVIENDSVISMNNSVVLPSDLPTLPPGDTEVTYDNTITKVEVKPNWWKV